MQKNSLKNKERKEKTPVLQWVSDRGQKSQVAEGVDSDHPFIFWHLQGEPFVCPLFCPHLSQK